MEIESEIGVNGRDCNSDNGVVGNGGRGKGEPILNCAVPRGAGLRGEGGRRLHPRASVAIDIISGNMPPVVVVTAVPPCR